MAPIETIDATVTHNMSVTDEATDGLLTQNTDR
jgi:hypothetical protein